MKENNKKRKKNGINKYDPSEENVGRMESMEDERKEGRKKTWSEEKTIM